VTRNYVGAALLLLSICDVACEPIAAPAPRSSEVTSARIEPGDRIPEFELTDQAPATLLGSVATLTFVVPGAAQPDAFLRRIDDVCDRLGADAARVGRYLVTLPAAGNESAVAERDSWQSLHGDPETVIDLAARFGVVAWTGSDGVPVQTLGVAVIGPGGLVAARFGGLETWEEMDLLVAITEASR